MSPDHQLGLVILAIAALIVLSRLLGDLAERFGQPPVIGELLLGILIGPSLLKAVAPDLVASVLPAQVVTLLHGVGNLGLSLFIFLVGLEIDQSALRRRFDRVAKVAAGAFVPPFAAGVLTATTLFSAHPGGGSQLAFTLLFGVVFACTALPVLARILTDRGLERTSAGTMALASAGVLDLVGWVILGSVLTIAAGHGLGGVLWKLVLFLVFVVVVKNVVVPLLLHWLHGAPTNGPMAQLAVLAATVFACAGTTQMIGLHIVIGPLVLGLLLPHQLLSERLGPIESALAPMTAGVLLPIYFATAGMGVDVSGFSASDVLQFVLLLALATAPKVVGTILGARWAGLSRREGLRLAVLLNTRGVMEVVVLNVGLSAGLLNVTLYSQLMIIALIATAMTGPLIGRLCPRYEQAGADGDPKYPAPSDADPAPTPSIAT
ncbi:MAG TPA: cation:proton antiporter [Gaiellaceae bacterium]|nr:cation:proton antiporter [Gaiellaceae bacterium]